MEESQLVDGSVDAGLYMLEKLAPQNRVYTQQELAEVCGCSHNHIGHIEQRAIKKLKLELERRNITIEDII